MTGSFTGDTALFEVLRNPRGKEVIARRAPGITDSPILHTLHRYPVGRLLATEPDLADRAEEQAAILNELARIDLTSPPRDRSRTPRPGLAVATGTAGHVAALTLTGTRWRRVEIALTGPIDSTVTLEAQVTSPDGSTVRVPGFWDGNDRYVIRVLPDLEGSWRFVTRSDSAQLNHITGTIHVGPAIGQDHGPVRVDGQFHFAHADGTPYRPIGTTAYAWTHQPEPLQEATLTTLAEAPFTKIRMGTTPKSYTFNVNEPDDYPFAGSVADGFDYDQPNPAYWRRLEGRIDQLAQLHIECDLILFHPYDRWGFATMSPTQDDAYVAYVVARLASFANIWWSLANEYDLLFSKTPEDWESFAAIIQRDDPYQHLLSIHNWHDFYDHARPWVTHLSVQWQDLRATEHITEWREIWGKPVIVDECAYEGDLDQRWGNISGEEMTRRFWEGTLRGGYVSHGETYTRADDVLWWAKGGHLHGESPARLRFLHDVLATAPPSLEPLPGDWGVPTAGIADNYYLMYFGIHRPSFRRFVMDPGVEYRVTVIDTWTMTIDELPGAYSGRFEIDLPGREFIAVRLVRAFPPTETGTR